MKEQIHNLTMIFGGFWHCIEWLLLLIILLLIHIYIKPKVLRITFSFFFSLFLVLELSSLYITQQFIGYSYYVHFNVRGTESLLLIFSTQILLSLIIYSFLTILFNKSNKINEFLQKFFSLKNIFIIISFTILTSFFILFKSNYFLDETNSLFNSISFTNNSKDFDEVLERNKMYNYIKTDKVLAKKGKNIIIISLESFELAFLEDEKFSKLTPNLRKLKSEWDFLKVYENHGSDWTSGSLYTSLTGLPAFFGLNGNNIFQNSIHSDIPSIIDALKKVNYENIYMNGNADHSGIKEMLFVLGFDKIIDKKNISQEIKLSSYGIRDMDLFNLAKQEISLQKQKNNPFNLFISTSDTHFPNGIYDKRMEKRIPKNESEYLFMIQAVDNMVGDFINYLKKNHLLDNTAVFIYPDHLKMGDNSIFLNQPERSLYVISNTNLSKFKKNDSKLYQIDIPKIILNGAEVESNIKFLTDYIEGDKNKYIEENINEITNLNTSGFKRFNTEYVNLPFDSKTYSKIIKDTLRFIAHAGGKINNDTYTNSLEALDYNYKKGFRIFELDIIKSKDNKYVAAHDWEHWKEITNYKGTIPPTLQDFLNKKIYNKYSPLGINEINNWFKNHPDAILVTDKINEPKLFSEAFIDKNRLMMELFTTEAVFEGIQCKIKSAMPSTIVIPYLKKYSAKELKKLGINNLSVSRRYLYINPDFLSDCLKEGILPYAFHLNADPGIDEKYVLKYESDYFYGIYADDWDF